MVCKGICSPDVGLNLVHIVTVTVDAVPAVETLSIEVLLSSHNNRRTSWDQNPHAVQERRGDPSYLDLGLVVDLHAADTAVLPQMTCIRAK